MDQHECKEAVLKYLKIRTEQLWKTTEAWSNRTKTFEEFKAEVYTLYPGMTRDCTYMIQDLDTLIGHWARIGIITAADLGKYYRRFILISWYLIGKNRLSTQEQSRTFFRGLQPQLESKVCQQLQQKFIDHFPDNPYKLPVVNEAVSYVLIGTLSTFMALTQGAGMGVLPNHVSPTVQDLTQVKLDALTSAITTLGEIFKTAIQVQNP